MRIWTALENLRTKSRERHHRLRFRHRGDGALPRAVRLCDPGGRDTENSAQQCNRTSDSPVDHATVSRGYSQRPYLSFPNPRSRQIFSNGLDDAVEALGLKVLRTPVRAPQANAYCERLVGTIRRECLDFMIPLSENHLRRILRDWIKHYNSGRPHKSLGPGLPIPDPELLRSPQPSRHQLPQGWSVGAKSVLSGLHHEYRLEKTAA